MSDTKRLSGGGLAAVMGARTLPPGPPEPVEVAETRGDVQARLACQRAGREAIWTRRLPRRYRTASLDSLRPQQKPETLVEWLGREGGADRWLNLLLTGPSRRGKTYAAFALGNAHVLAGGYAVAWTLADLNAALRPDGDPMAFDRVISVDLLILDDIGREQVTAWTLEQLTRILDARNREGLRTGTTTNLDYASMIERYGDPIVQRLLDDCEIVKVEGDRIDGGESPW